MSNTPTNAVPWVPRNALGSLRVGDGQAGSGQARDGGTCTRRGVRGGCGYGGLTNANSPTPQQSAGSKKGHSLAHDDVGSDAALAVGGPCQRDQRRLPRHPVLNGRSVCGWVWVGGVQQGRSACVRGWGGGGGASGGNQVVVRLGRYLCRAAGLPTP